MNARPHLLGLTGIRGYAALWVVIYHFFSEFSLLFPALTLLNPFSAKGYLAVDLFFQLSGFVLAYNYMDKLGRSFSTPTFKHFVYMRFARIYPVHLVTLLAVLAMYLVGRKLGYNLTDEGYTLTQFVQNLFLVQAWVPKLTLNWNYPSWSVSSEWFAYLSFPFVVLLFKKVDSLAKALMGLVLSLVIAFLTTACKGQVSFDTLWRISCHFTAGVFLYQISQFHKAKEGPLKVLIYGPLTILLTGPFWASSFYPYLSFVCFPPLIFGLAQTKERYTLFDSRFSLYWGEASYSLYMTHTIAQKFLYRLLPVQRFTDSSLMTKLGVLAGYVFFIALLCLATFHLVENPARRWLKKIYPA